MHDVMRERLWRKLQALPDEQLYQALDFIEFLESKYARGRAAEPTGLQRFAERFEDRMRDMAVAPRYIKGAVGVFGTASKMVQGVLDAGKAAVETSSGVLDELITPTSQKAQDAKPAQPILNVETSPENEAKER